MSAILNYKNLFGDTRKIIDGALLVHRNCPLCNCTNYYTVETLTDLQFFVDLEGGVQRIKYSQVMCKHCTVLYMNPCYTNKGFEVLFALAGRSYGDGGGRHSEQINWLKENDCLDNQFTYMDIGCFEGDFLLSLPSSAKLIGIDFDDGAIVRAKAKPRLRDALLINGRFEEFHIDESVDVYTMFHVLEHLPDPVGVLKQMAKFAHDLTSLIVEVPVLEKGKTNDIHGFYSPQHLSHFSIDTLDRALALAGWKITATQMASDYNGYRVHARLMQQEAFNLDDKVVNDDLRLVFQERSYHFQRLSEISLRLESLPDWKAYVIWGAGMHLELLYQRTELLMKLDGRQVRVIDSDSVKQGKKWRGLAIESASDVFAETCWEESVLVISSYGGQTSIYQSALDMGVPREAIFLLYDVVNSY